MLSLLFLVTTNNYLDRIVFTVLIPVIREDLHLNDLQYGFVNAAFNTAYTIGFLAMGWFIDRFGTRVGYAVSLAWWSVAACLHAFARVPLQLGMFRALLGFGESGNFPSAIKAVAEWFPKKDRAFATGIFNAGTNVASMVGPPLFVWMAFHMNWRDCFLVTGGTGFVLVAVWIWFYRQPGVHKSVNDAERAYINSDSEAADNEPAIGWLQALGVKQTWGFALAKFLTDPVWWFYLYWLPPYLYDVRKFDMKSIGWALPVVYLMADFGSVAGGWFSGYLIRRGWPNGKARKTSMAVFASVMPLAATSVLAPNPILAIALISLAVSAHQGWSANLFTTTSDVFPRRAVASVTGIGGCLGGFGGVVFSTILPGYLVTHFGYTPVFLIMGVFHLTALLVMHKLMGRMEMVTQLNADTEHIARIVARVGMGVAGALLGGITGYMLRPASALLTPAAQTSFSFTMQGVLIGAAVGVGIGFLMRRKPPRRPPLVG
jgi:MFS transporter, ACS family, hexuronate transporter